MAGFNWIDGVLLVLVVIVAWGATNRGFLQVCATLVSFVLAVLAALLGTPGLGEWLRTHTALPDLWRAPVAFLALWIGAQLLFTGLAHVVLRRTFYHAARSGLNRWLAIVPGAVQGLLIGGLILSMLALAPLPGLPQQAILHSAIGASLVQATVALERPLEDVFGPALRQSLGVLTVPSEPQSGETVELHFRVARPAPDGEAEERMLALVNAERSGRGLTPLVMDPALQVLGRAHAVDMFQQGYFSHTGRDGRSPFDRMRDAHIAYTTAGENLALAPSTEFAHEGLMNSPGHRANILNPHFLRVGIGVLDGGIDGKMFVQEFTD